MPRATFYKYSEQMQAFPKCRNTIQIKYFVRIPFQSSQCRGMIVCSQKVYCPILTCWPCLCPTSCVISRSALMCPICTHTSQPDTWLLISPLPEQVWASLNITVARPDSLSKLALPCSHHRRGPFVTFGNNSGKNPRRCKRCEIVGK